MLPFLGSISFFMENAPIFNPEHLNKLANTKMPFGKYKGSYLVNLPEHYVVWFKQKGFPEGQLGNMLQEIYEIKLNGLEDLIRKLIKR
jgi:uncharacterized protein (DUF3820 family)